MSAPSRSVYYLSLTAIIWCLSFSLMKGWGEVHEWANVSWLMNYDLGFIKRGLWGSLISWFNPSDADITPEHMKILGIALLFLFISALLIIALRVLKLTNTNWAILLLILVFFTSPFLTMLANIRNYLDIPISLLGIGALFFSIRKQYIPAMFALSIGVFIHELIIVIFMPLLVLTLILQHQLDINTKDSKSPLHQPSSWFAVLIPLACLVIIILNQQTLNIDVLRARIDDRLVSLLPMDNDRAKLYSEMLTYSFTDYLQEESLLFKGRITNPDFLFTIGLFPLITLLLAWQLLAEQALRERILLILVTAGASIAPLTLHLIAFDTNRIWAMPILSCFLSLWLIIEILPNQKISKHIFPGLLLLCTWIVYWLIEPIIMFNAEIILYQSDVLQAAFLPIAFVCYHIARSLSADQIR